MEKASLKIRFAAALDAVVYPAKLVIKNTVPVVGSFLLFIAGAKVNRDGYEKRILIIFGGGIGDVVKRSIVCGYLERYLPQRERFYLMPYKLALPYGKETIIFDYKRAKVDPRYYFSLVNRLRKIGFSEVVVLLPAWEGFLASLGKDIHPDRVHRYVEQAPKELIGSASSLFGWRERGRVFHDIPVVSYYDPLWKDKGHFPSDTHKMVYVISQVIKAINGDIVLDEKGIAPFEGIRTEVAIDPFAEESYLKAFKAEYNVDIGDYCLIGLGTSTPAKDWPVAKFVEAARFLKKRGVPIAIVDHPKDMALVREFEKGFGKDFLNLTGALDLPKLCILMKHAKLVLCNDTSFAHFAVALRTPCVCMCRNHQVGADSCYGYEDINKWVFGDRIELVEVADVITALDALLIHIENAPAVPQERFVDSYFPQ